LTAEELTTEELTAEDVLADAVGPVGDAGRAPERRLSR